MIGSGMGLSAVLVLTGPDLVLQAPISSEAVLTMLVYAIVFAPMAAIGLLFARIEGFGAMRAGQVPAGWGLLGLAMGSGGLALSAALAALAGSLVRGEGSRAGAVAFAAGFLLILFQTASEEVFFRGWLLRALERRIGALAAIGLSALLFAGFHVLGGARVPLSLLNLLLGGVWFALLAVRSGGLVAPLAAHFGWNASEELIAGLSPNPGTGSFGALADWDLVGSPLWGGTEDGLNSSIGMASVLLALILPLLGRRAAVPSPAS